VRKKIYLTVFIIVLITMSFSFFSVIHSLNVLKKEFALKQSNTRLQEYNLLLKEKKAFLISFAKFLANSQIVINAYLHNDRNKIIKFVLPLYKSLYPDYIEEIHFFKNGGISFVNFSNLKAYNINLKNIRKDVVHTSSPSVHFLTCRHYPGLRIIYPIKYKNKILGALSFGINLSVFKKLFEKLGATNVSLYLNDHILKNFLSKTRYERFEKLPLYKNFRIIGKPLNVKLQEGYELKGESVYTVIVLKDFYSNTLGYLIIEDNLSKEISHIKSAMIKQLSIDISGFLLILFVIIFIFRWLFSKLDELEDILEKIKTKNFDKLPQKTDSRDELDLFKNSLLEVAKEIKSHISGLNSKIKLYTQKAYIDGLTNTLNRRFLEEKGKELFSKYKIFKIPVGVIMFDIDNFKKINDTYGHDTGDKVLKTLAQTVKKIIRKNDYFIRYGGEEFLLILPYSEPKSTKKVAEKIRKEIEKLSLSIDNKKLKFTVSMGISKLKPEDKTIMDAIKRADERLYRAKNRGKNRIET